MPKRSESSPTPNIKRLTPEDFEYLCFDLARELLSFNEPIPDYSTRDISLLESALGAPGQTFDQQLLYPTLEKQAVVLFYSLIKNHPFRNGNKRIAVMGLLTFLSLNKKWIDIQPKLLYQIACKVSESLPENRKEIFQYLEGTLENSLVDFPTNN